MRIESLTLYQFRNLSDQTISFSPRLNVITGRNGQGKTNLVEAIHLLSAARSFRTSSNSELWRWNSKQCSVFADVQAERNEESDRYSLGMLLDDGAKAAFLNGQKLTSMTEFLGKLLAVTFSPTDIALIKGAPALRRRFIDKHLIDCFPLLARELMQVHRAVKTKSKILKDKQVDEAALDVCDDMLASAGVAVNAARRDFLDRVELRASLCMHAIAPGDGTLGLRLKSSFPVTEEAALEKLREVRPREKMLRACLLGPQRDDVEIVMSGHDSRAFSSQGQSRSLVLALKLSMVGLIEEHRHDSPLLILDDFDSELDSGRCEALLEEVKKGGRQVFITGVSRRPEMQVEGLPIRCFEVSQGIVSLADL